LFAVVMNRPALVYILQVTRSVHEDHAGTTALPSLRLVQLRMNLRAIPRSHLEFFRIGPWVLPIFACRRGRQLLRFRSRAVVLHVQFRRLVRVGIDICDRLAVWRWHATVLAIAECNPLAAA